MSKCKEMREGERFHGFKVPLWEGVESRRAPGPGCSLGLSSHTQILPQGITYTETHEILPVQAEWK